MYIRVASRVIRQPKTYNLKKLGKITKIKNLLERETIVQSSCKNDVFFNTT